MPLRPGKEEGEEVENALPAGQSTVSTWRRKLFCLCRRPAQSFWSGSRPDGTLYATNLGYDDRGERAVKNSPDWLVKIEEGAWYGWPDYAGELPLSDERFASERGVNLNPLIENHPQVQPPLAELPSHYSPMKLDFAPEGFKDQGLFVAIFGDGQPLTEDLEEQVPTGVIIVDPESGEHEWFIKNKEKPRGGRWGDGFKALM